MGRQKSACEIGSLKRGMAAQVVEQQEPGDAGCHPDDRVRDDGRGLVRGRADAVGTRDDRCRERDDRHREQQDEVPPEDSRVDLQDPREGGVVAQPQHADVGERRQVRDVTHPLLAELLGELAARCRDRELEDEQRDGDREHAIAECFDPVALAEAWSSSVAHVRVIVRYPGTPQPPRCHDGFHGGPMGNSCRRAGWSLPALGKRTLADLRTSADGASCTRCDDSGAGFRKRRRSRPGERLNRHPGTYSQSNTERSEAVARMWRLRRILGRRGV